MKKIIVVIAVVFLLNTVTYAFEDVDQAYLSKINPLIEKGVINGCGENKIRLKAQVTRAEFCKMVSVLFDLQGEKDKTVVFDDVALNHWAFEYIMLMKRKGIINGSGDNSFKPDNGIKYQDAVKIIVHAMGFGERANDLGGYPNGFLDMGLKLGIVSKHRMNEFVTREQVIDMLLKVYSSRKAINKDVNLSNFMIQNTIKCRDKGNVKGAISCQHKIVSLKWAYFDSDGNLIMIKQKDNIGHKNIFLEDYIEDFGLDRLAVGKVNFKVYVKTDVGGCNILSEDILVEPKEENREDDKEDDCIVLNMDYINISQGPGGKGGHKGTYAIDLVGKDRGTDDLYAPFDGIITKIYSIDNMQNFVWLESKYKVKFADGSYDYATVMTGHDNNIDDLYVGKEIKKGECYYQEGDSGKSTGNHIHLEVGKGKTTEKGWIKNDDGRYQIENHVFPSDVFYIFSNTTIIDDKGLNFKYR